MVGKHTHGEVTISKEEYDSLILDSLLLECLENCGVDNWDGWDCAVEAYTYQKELWENN